MATMGAAPSPQWVRKLVRDFLGEPDDDLADLLWEESKDAPDRKAWICECLWDTWNLEHIEENQEFLDYRD